MDSEASKQVERFHKAFFEFRRGFEAEILHKMNAQITGPQMFMLLFISQRDTCKLTHLAEKMEVKPSAVTVMIDRLEKMGYVTRTHDTVDRRSVLVTATDAGKAVLEKATAERNRILGTYLSRLEPEEVELISHFFEKMTQTEKTGGTPRE